MIEIKITYDQETGRIDVTGPLHETLACIDLLAGAMRVVTKNAPPRPEEKRLIELATAVPHFGRPV